MPTPRAPIAARAAPDTADGPGVTWLGHSAARVTIGDTALLIDPLGRRRSIRNGPSDAVLVTHAHVDHLNRWTLAALPRELTLVVPRGAAGTVRDLGFARLIEVRAGDVLAIGGAVVHAVPTCHDNGRWRRAALPECVGYVMQAASGRGPVVYHAGDVDVGDHAVFDEIGEQFPIACSLLPIGGMLPVWYYRWRSRTRRPGVHIDPDAALTLFQRLGAGALVPIHWGTVNLRLESPSAAASRLTEEAERRGLRPRVRILSHGEHLDLRPALSGTGR